MVEQISDLRKHAQHLHHGKSEMAVEIKPGPLIYKPYLLTTRPLRHHYGVASFEMYLDLQFCYNGFGAFTHSFDAWHHHVHAVVLVVFVCCLWLWLLFLLCL